MAEAKQTVRVAGGKRVASRTRSATNGRFVSQNERVAAARARVQADRKRGVTTEAWIVDLAKQGA
ncbi:hypothetical protein [Blastococcus atacamensis]|uniref:hypothetical protein n=1 Tax=Blastococcus atacamensis TaxID=2070508 RepID=UPI000CECA4E7|nr:hypothetical protein [Blastococcus atacamensis]